MIRFSLAQQKDPDGDFSSGDENEFSDRTYNYIDHDVDLHSIYGCDQMPILRKASTKQILRCEGALPLYNSYSLKEINKSGDHLTRQLSFHDTASRQAVKPRKRWFETGSVDTVNLGSAMDIFCERPLDRNESKRFMNSFERIVEEDSKTVYEREEERKRNEILKEKL